MLAFTNNRIVYGVCWPSNPANWRIWGSETPYLKINKQTNKETSKIKAESK